MSCPVYANVHCAYTRTLEKSIFTRKKNDHVYLVTLYPFTALPRLSSNLAHLVTPAMYDSSLLFTAFVQSKTGSWSWKATRHLRVLDQRVRYGPVPSSVLSGQEKADHSLYSGRREVNSRQNPRGFWACCQSLCGWRHCVCCPTNQGCIKFLIP